MNPFRQFPSKTAVLCLLALALLAAGPALTQEGAQEEAMEAPEMSAEEAAMMEAWMKAMTPGPQHQMLADTAGEWKFTIKSWMDPEAEPMVSEGTAHRTMELGGRVVEEVVESSMMGQPFEGIGRTGYDNLTGEWWSTWTDNMSTGLMTMTGTYDEATHTWTWTGEGTDPMTGNAQKMKMTVVKEGEDKEVGTMWQAGPDGEMRKTMEIVYTR
jgi:hypothetical protein